MSKFWVGVGIIFIAGVIAASSATGETKTFPHDLETECRGDKTTSNSITLQPDNSLRFKGYFPVENTNSKITYSYRQGNSIVLNVKSQKLPAPEFLWDSCLASGIYDIQTDPLQPGSYPVEVKHNGKRIEKKVIRVRN